MAATSASRLPGLRGREELVPQPQQPGAGTSRAPVS